MPSIARASPSCWPATRRRCDKRDAERRSHVRRDLRSPAEEGALGRLPGSRQAAEAEAGGHRRLHRQRALRAAGAPRGACSRSRPGATKRPWSAGAPMASITASRRRAASRCSRTITCASARSPPTTRPPQGLARRRSSAWTKRRSAPPRAVTITEITPSDGACDLCRPPSASIHRRKASWTTSCSKASTTPASSCCSPPGAMPMPPALGSPRRSRPRKSLRHRQVRIIRDYGMFDRREAPQFYPTVNRASSHCRTKRRLTQRRRGRRERRKRSSCAPSARRHHNCVHPF